MNENKKKLENTLDFYNEKMTKQAVGRLFQEYMDEGEENYFIPEKKYNRDYVNENPRAYSKSYYDEFGREGYQNQYYNDSNNKYYDSDFRYYDDGYDSNYDEPAENYTNVPYGYDRVNTYAKRRKRATSSKSSNNSKSRKKAKKPQPQRASSPERKMQKSGYYENSYYEGEKKSISFLTVILGIFSVILLFAVTFLSYKLNVANAEYENISERLNNELEDPSNIEELNSLTAEVESLKKENEQLKNGKASSANSALTSNNGNTDNNAENGTSNSADGDTKDVPSEYTVGKGDNAWKISEKVYGKGDYYQKILEANNLDNASSLFVGQVLVIPEI